ncbi:prolyl oligopeptidase family serine peptidase [Alienimonas californiensis]|uniref:Prolyl tripeptidyl peptidase n=1 Tax=Alienimonas californiensis TaxID=2527989 RepID=A0A517PEZ9_9PLAN|nr:prolyl oligopeptidase family serine peptidase [Alienimonas californiensis]QDT17948.1 Prolyl tripeptidyl peptidase precursor [Alienimonas californiensis]
MTASLLLLALILPTAAEDGPANVGADRPFADFDAASAWVGTTGGGVFRDRVRPQPIEGTPDFWYRIETGPGTAEFLLVRPADGVREPAFDHAAVAAALSRRGGERVRPDALPFRSVTFPDGPDGPVRFRARGARWEIDGTEVRRIDEPGDAVERGSYGVEFLNRPRPSRSGSETNVTFVNRTAGPIALFWLNDGQETGYGQIPAGERRGQHTYAGHVWRVRDAAGESLAVVVGTEQDGVAVIDGPMAGSDPESPPAAPERASPPPIRLRDGNVFLTATGRRLTDADAKPVPEGYRKILYRGPVLTSPDGRTVAVQRAVVAPVREITLTPDGAEPIRLDYPKPGDLRDQSTPVFFDAATGERVDVPTERLPDQFSLGRWRWSADGEELFFLHNPRGHRFLQILAANRETGAVRVVVDEQSDTFVDYSQKTELHWLPVTDGEPETLLWASERSGWNHLYRIDAKSGAVLNAVTAGEWVVRRVEKIEDGRVWFTALGVVPGQDPYYEHLCRANLDGSGFVTLTSDDAKPGDGTHEWEFLSDGAYLLDRFSRVDLPPVTVLRDAETGALHCELERADAAARLATGWRPPVRFSAKGRDGATDIHGTVTFPPGFDPDAAERGTVPILDNVYAGPHGAFAPKAWGDARHVRELAALGFAVVQCDGMGTNWRSRAFHDVCWRDLADSGFPDRVRFIRALAGAYPALDRERVGIYGGSAGGQSALRALLSHGDLYKAAAADCGCHDNRVDKLWWNEAWLGRLGPHYDDSSNVRDAARLQGDLLLTLGGMDRNVDPACTLETAAALEAAGKEFTLKIYPEGGHGVGERDDARRLRAEFFRQTLGRR